MVQFMRYKSESVVARRLEEGEKGEIVAIDEKLEDQLVEMVV